MSLETESDTPLTFLSASKRHPLGTLTRGRWRETRRRPANCEMDSPIADCPAGVNPTLLRQSNCQFGIPSFVIRNRRSNHDGFLGCVGKTTSGRETVDEVAFRNHDTSNYQVPILELAGTSAATDDILSKETLWQATMQSREMDLNCN